jgi:hypothetical protein
MLVKHVEHSAPRRKSKPQKSSTSDFCYWCFCEEIRATTPSEREAIIKAVEALTPAELTAGVARIPKWQIKLFDAIAAEIDANLRRSLPEAFPFCSGCAR